jgi:hypothetical protein
MVNMDNVTTKLRRGLFVGIGTFGSTFVGNFMEGVTPGGDIGTAVAQLGVGAGMSVAADEFVDDYDSIQNDVVEYSGYGVQGAAWAEMADMITAGTTSGGVTEVDVTEVSRTQASQPTNNRRQEKELSIDV